MFNDTSCARCHLEPAVGGSSALLETRFGARKANGTFDPLTEHGGSLIQVKGIGVAGACDFTGEKVPQEANASRSGERRPSSAFGLVDAVPEGTFRYVAQLEHALWPDEAGRVAMVHDIAQESRRGRPVRLEGPGADAAPVLRRRVPERDGHHQPEFPDENCPNGDCSLLACNPLPGINDGGEGIVAFTDFMTLLGRPPRRPMTGQAWAGKRVFGSIGCSHCHWDTFRTGDSAVASLDHVTFHPYSDFLLHDMGGLGDGIEAGDARGREFRTAPLWGVSAFTSYLHDGRAATVKDAILAHDGQARRARERFARASADDQAALLAFLGTL